MFLDKRFLSLFVFFFLPNVLHAQISHFEEFDDSTSFAQDWIVGPEYVLNNGELENTNVAPNTNWSLAIFSKYADPREVTMVFGSATFTGIRQGGLALRLSNNELNANGYFIRYNSTNNFFELFAIVGGNPAGLIDSITAGGQFVGTGDTMKVALSSDGSGHHFQISVNSQIVGTVTDTFKAYGNESMQYSGILLKGDESNNVDRWTYTGPPDSVPPARIDDLQVTSVSAVSVTLHWTAPADDNGFGGQVHSYDARYFTSPIDETNFLFATPALNFPAPENPGVSQQFLINNLDQITTYYFAIKSRDNSANISAISNVSSTTTQFACIIDDFSAADFGPQWTLGSEFVITNGEMENTSVDNGWEHLAVYNQIRNVSEVSLQYGLTSDVTGRGGTGLALLLDANSTSANGYLCFIKSDNTLQLWTLVDGGPERQMSSARSTQAPLKEGQVFKVVVSSNAAGHHFEFYINSVSAGKLTDPNKHQGNSSTAYSGIMLRGGSNNNIDNFTLNFQCDHHPIFFSKVSGDNQTGIKSAPLPNPLVVKITDENNNPLPGVPVIFDVTAGGGAIEPVIDQSYIFIEAESGTIIPPMVIVNDSAASRGQYVISPNGSGSNGKVTLNFHVTASGNYKIWGHAKGPGGTSDSFFVTVNGVNQLVWDVFQGTPTTDWTWDEVSDRGSGNGAIPEVDPVLFQLDAGLNTVVVQTRDDGTSLDKIFITNNLNFVPQGIDEEETATTDNKGEAKAVWTLGPQIGTNNNQAQATAQGLPALGSQIFTASATSANTADTITLDSGNNQSGPTGQPLPIPFQVKVLSKSGTPVENHDVTFTVTGGGGNFSGSGQITIQTNASGCALATLTLGPASGATNQAQVSSLFDGALLSGSPVIFTATADFASSVDVDISSIPKRFALSQSYPNPFNPEMHIDYELPLESKVKVAVYNLKGEQVRILFSGEKNAGRYSVSWDGKSKNGLSVASGVYLIRIEAEKFVAARKVVFTK